MDKYLHEELRLKMVHRALSFGIASLASAILLFTIPFIAIGLGFLAIMFAVLSRGYKPNLDKDAKSAIVMGILGICVGTSIIGATMHKLTTDADYRNAVFQAIEEQLMDTYGESFSDSFEDLIGGGSNVDL